MILTAPVLATSLVLGPMGLQDVQNLDRNWYELRDIIEAARLDPHSFVDLRTHLPCAWLDNLEPEGYFSCGNERESLDTDSMVEYVRNSLLNASGVEVEWISSHGGRLVLIANERAHEVAAETLRVLRHATAETFTVDIHRLDDTSIPPTTASHLDAAATTKLVDTIPGTLVARERVRAGFPVALTDSEWSTLLFDYDVEVAQFAVATDPTVTFVQSGIEVAVRVDRAADGRRFVVRTWGRDGALDGKPRTLRIESHGGSPIELPKVRTSLWAASGIIEPGGALVIDHDGGGRSALVVRVGADGVSPESHESVVPLGELGLPPMRVGIPDLRMVEPSSGWATQDEAVAFGATPWNVSSLPSEFAMDVIEPGLNEGRAALLDSRVLLFDGELPSKELRAKIDALRSELDISTISVDVRYDYVPAAELARILDEGGPEALAAKAHNRLQGSVVEGDTLLLVGGVETAYLRDFDVQVAQAAVIGDPIISCFFEGFAFWCAPFQTPGGTLSSWFEVRAQGSDEEIRGIETSCFVRTEKADKSGPTPEGRFEERLFIELPVSHRATAKTRIEARAGDWSLVAARRIAETDRALVVVARMGVQ